LFSRALGFKTAMLDKAELSLVHKNIIRELKYTNALKKES